jgi:hypothetical protein
VQLQKQGKAKQAAAFNPAMSDRSRNRRKFSFRLLSANLDRRDLAGRLTRVLQF